MDQILETAEEINREAWRLREDEPDLEVGIAYHLVKTRSREMLAGRPTAEGEGSYADPAAELNAPGYRFAHYYRRRRAEAVAVAQTLTRFPLTLGVVRAVDVCTDELGVPTWVVAPLLRHMRRAGELAAMYLDRRLDGRFELELHASPHAGEDFVHLLEGLRRMDEAVTRLPLGHRDRIGHGLALGIDVDTWCRQRDAVPVALEDRLFDLLWEWQFYSRGSRSPGEPDRVPFLTAELGRLSRQIFGRSCSPEQLDFFQNHLFDTECLRELRFPDGPVPSRSSCRESLRLLRQYLTDSEVFARGRQVEWVAVEEEAPFLNTLQRAMRQKLRDLGITVEINPSSNLLIGNLSDLAHHPLWKMSPPRVGLDGEQPVPICVGSDDPVVFATHLRGEYRQLTDALVRGGIGAGPALEWVDAVRQRGMWSRFTLPPLPELKPDPRAPQGQMRAHPAFDLWSRLEAPP